MDELLPRVLLDAIQTNLNMSGAIILTAVVSPMFLIPFTVVAILFLIVRNIYVHTSKNIKRLEGVGEWHKFAEFCCGDASAAHS